MNIEKKLTQIWIGPNPAPLSWMHTWRDKHPEWEYSIFTDEMLRNRKWHNSHLIERYYNMRIWPGVSDLIRYELLYEHGGFWPEADMTCLENTDELFTAPADHAYSCFEDEAGRGNNIQPIMACNPGNEFVRVDREGLPRETYVKVDGNRQIIAYVLDDKEVKAVITDLRKKYPDLVR